MVSPTGSAEPPRNVDTFDVCIIGGVLSGSATTLLLLLWHPGPRICIVEKSEVFFAPGG